MKLHFNVLQRKINYRSYTCTSAISLSYVSIPVSDIGNATTNASNCITKNKYIVMEYLWLYFKELNRCKY